MKTVQDSTQLGRVADAPSGHWVYHALPKRFWPLAQLARWDRPIGWWLLLWPCWWGAAMAAASNYNEASGWLGRLPDPWHLVLFLIGAIAMRGAGCTYNDIIDHKIDAQVERTRSRPIPSGKISRKSALAFLIAQALIGLLVLLQFNSFAIILGLSSIAIVTAYPFMKRITDWPQLVLGLAFSWGALMGWAAFYGHLKLAPLLLYCAAILWTIGYDTIYAHQDREDDALVGVRSTARLFGVRTKSWLWKLYGGMLVLILLSIWSAGINIIAIAGVAIAGSHLARQIKALDIDDPDQCLALFKSNTQIGWIIFLSFVAAGLWDVLKTAL